MARQELVATRNFKYLTRRLLPGDVFEAKNALEAKILTDVRKVAAVPLPKPARKAPEPVIPTVDEVLTAEVVEPKPAAPKKARGKLSLKK